MHIFGLDSSSYFKANIRNTNMSYLVRTVQGWLVEKKDYEIQNSLLFSCIYFDFECNKTNAEPLYERDDMPGFFFLGIWGKTQLRLKLSFFQ